MRGNQKKRIFWLTEHLGEYLQRWLGFASMDQLTVEATFDNDAFCIILGVCAVISEHLSNKDANWFPSAEWGKFENALDFIQAYPRKENLTVVVDSFNCFSEVLKIGQE